MKRKLAIAVCYYFPEKEYLSNEACIPLQLGYDETHVDMRIQRDNEGDNRGDKHPYYSELSGLYWIWKNADSEYKGLYHHRRAFAAQEEKLSSKLYYMYRKIRCELASLIKSKEFINMHQINVPETAYKDHVLDFLKKAEKEYLGRYEMILPKPAEMWPLSLRRYESDFVGLQMFQQLNSIIEEYYPNYITYWKRALSSQKFYYANMSIMRTDIFDDYCTFVFGVLDILEDKLIKEGYYQSLGNEKSMSRKLGYVGEILTNVYIFSKLDKNAKVIEVPVLLNTHAKRWVD
jgi:hypothetical protein